MVIDIDENVSSQGGVIASKSGINQSRKLQSSDSGLIKPPGSERTPGANMRTVGPNSMRTAD